MSVVGYVEKAASRLSTSRLPSATGSAFSSVTGVAGDIANRFSPAQALISMGSYGTVGWLFSVVSRSSEAIAQVEWTSYKGRGKNRDELETSVLYELLEEPNPFMLRDELIEIGSQHFLLVGEMYFLKLRNRFGVPVELWPIRPDLITPVPSRDDYLAGYVYRDGSEYIPLAVDDVICVKRPDPIDMYHGRGVIQAIISDLQGERAAAKWNRNFFYNSAEPGGVIQFDHPISKKDFDQFLLDWNRNHGGVDNAHRVAVLTRGKWVDRKMSQRDMQFGDLRKVNRDTILGAFGFPLPILGITENVNKANAEAAAYHFTKWVVSPPLRRLRNALNHRLAPDFDKTILLDYADPVPEDRKLGLDIGERGWKAGLLKKNEARDLLGFDYESDGDVYFDGTAPVKVYRKEAGPFYCPCEKPDGEVCGKRLPLMEIQGAANVFCRSCKNEISMVSDEVDPILVNSRKVR